MIKDFPINFNICNSSILDLESFKLLRAIIDNYWEWNERRVRVIAKSNLVVRNNKWRAVYSNVDWKLELRKPFDGWHKFIFKFATGCIIKSDGDRNFRVRMKSSFIWCKHNCYTLVILKIELLLFIHSFSSSYCFSCSWWELIHILMGIS